MTVENLIEERLGVRQSDQTADTSSGDDATRTYYTQNVVDVRLDRDDAALLLSALSLVIAVVRLHQD